jgi:putative heme iron utilization protein
MLKSTIRDLRALFEGPRVLSLAVSADGVPYAGLLPFVAFPDCSAVLIHASRMSKHSRGLLPAAHVGVLIHEQDAPGKDALQLKRASFECVVHPLERGSPAWTAARVRYLERFPDSRITFGLRDFTLYRLELLHGLYVAGFGRAMDLEPDDIRKLATPAPAASTDDDDPQ